MVREEDEYLDPREAERERRRDRDMSAAGRAGMRSGLAKGFRQIADAQTKRDKALAARRKGAKRLREER